MRADALTVGLALLAVACTRHTAAEPATDLHEPSRLAWTVGDDVGGASPAGDAGGAGECNGGERTPLSGFAEQLELRDGKEKLGFASIPIGAREPRPIMIALHGGSERPERACSAWRGITEAYPFVVCPRGWGGNE